MNISTFVIRFSPWSISVYNVWVVPEVPDLTSVRPKPTPTSTNLLFKDSLVIDFCGSLITTWPIGSERAKDSAACGSELGLSLLVWG